MCPFGHVSHPHAIPSESAAPEQAHVQEKANLEARKPWAAAPTCPAEARLEAADEVPGPRACWGEHQNPC